MAGREVLIKSTAQAILAYCMSMYLLPSILGNEIQRKLNSFWWGSGNTQARGVNWLAWDKLTLSKRCGGMGFRNLHAFKLAMLVKQAWRVIQALQALVSRVFKAKYLPNHNFLDTGLKHNPSYVWRSLWTSRDILRAGTRWCIGRGDSIPMWGSPWVRGCPLPISIPPPSNGVVDLMV